MPYRGQIPLKEHTTQDAAKSGTETKKIAGPAVGGKHSNPTTGGGINRATKGKS